jgi:hypothetical protein
MQEEKKKVVKQPEQVLLLSLFGRTYEDAVSSIYGWGYHVIEVRRLYHDRVQVDVYAWTMMEKM